MITKQNKKFNYFIGIDVSKDFFNYAIINHDLELIKQDKFSMDFKGFSSFKNVIKEFPNSIIALESTGIYHINILSFLLDSKFDVCLINPQLIKQFSKSVSLRNTKTDKIDANIIAKFIAKYHQHINLFSLSNIDEITLIARTRESIAKDIAKTKTKLKQIMIIAFPEILQHFNIFTKTFLNLLLHFPTAKHFKKANLNDIKSIINQYTTKGRNPDIDHKFIKKLAKKSISSATHITAANVTYLVKQLIFLNEQLDEITKIFIDEINKSKKEDIEIIKSIKGISDITAAHFISEIKDIERFENKNKLIAYCGTDPSVKQSGSSIYGRSRISKKGSRTLRRTIYLIAMALIRCNMFFKVYYLKKRKEGFSHRKAMIALCNKILRIIYALLKKREYFDEEKYMQAIGLISKAA